MADLRLTTEDFRDVLRRVYPSANSDVIDRFAAPMWASMQRGDINTRLRAAHFIGQIGHETGQFRWLEEIASGEAYEGRVDLGNTEPGDGRRFKGRGLIQLTGRDNYRAFSAAMGLGRELLSDPDQVADDPWLSVEAARWYWGKRQINAMADRDDLRSVTRAINGGMNGYADRLKLMSDAKKSLNWAEVRVLQRRLNAHGADLMEDGKFGAQTQSELFLFQDNHDYLLADGIAGEKTWAALDREPTVFIDPVDDRPVDIKVIVDGDTTRGPIGAGAFDLGSDGGLLVVMDQGLIISTTMISRGYEAFFTPTNHDDEEI